MACRLACEGVRLLGRTAVECTRDELADAIGKDIAAIAGTAPSPVGVLVIDPFGGSGNTLYWMLRHLPGAEGLGFELDAAVFQLTRQNLAALKSRFDWSTARVYGLNAPGENHGVLLGTRGWMP